MPTPNNIANNMRKSLEKYHTSFKDPLYYVTPHTTSKKEEVDVSTLQTLKRMESMMCRFEQIFMNMANSGHQPQQTIPNDSFVTVRSQYQDIEFDADDPSLRRSATRKVDHHASHLTQKSHMSTSKVKHTQDSSSRTYQLAGKQFGDLRDRECIVPFSMNTDERHSYEEVLNAVSKWISEVMDILMKETFSGFSSDVTNSDCRIFMCNNMVLGFHSVSEFLNDNYPELWSKHSQDIVAHIQYKFTEALEYYMSKYPSHAKILIPREVELLLATVDKSNIPIFNLLRRLRLSLNPYRYFPNDYVEGYALTYNYRKDIRNLINACIQECKSHYDQFQCLMEEIFTINVKTGKHTEMKPIPGNKVGMKFKRNMPIIPNENANGPTIEINSSEVLRVLIKWIEELDEFLEHPEVHIRSRSDLEPFVVDPMYRDGEVVFLSEEAKWKLTQEIIILKKKLKSQGEWHFHGLYSVFHHLTQYVRAHKDQFDFLPDNTIKTGMAISLLDAMTTQTAVVYLNRMLGLLYDALCRAFPKGNKLLDQESARLLEFAPFTTKDLLRAQCYGDIDEMRQILHNISEDERVTIVRVKNRLSTPNHDFLINFTFKGCQLICELQVGLDLKEKVEHKSEERKGFSHFLYELSRSKFGPLVEAALIVNNVSEMGRYFRKKTKPCRRLGEIKFNAEMGSDFQLVVTQFTQLGSSANFICSRCLQPKYANRAFQAGWRKGTLQQYLCSQCIYDHLPAHHKPIYAMGGKQGSFFRVSRLEDLDKQPQQCIATVDPLRYGPASSMYYSSMNSQREDYKFQGTEKVMETPQGYEDRIARELHEEELSHKYFGCFEIDSKVFYRKSHFDGKLVFELAPLSADQRIELVTVTEKCEGELDVLLHIIGKIGDVGSTVSTGYPMFMWSAAIPVNRTYQQTAICLVDPTHNALLVLDFEDRNCQAKRLNFFKKNVSSKISLPQNRANYQKSGYNEQMFRFLQKGKDVEELNLNENNFRTTDFLEIPNLRSLSLRLNRIESLQVTAKKLDQLRFLDLCGNGIGHLKFGQINLPQLKTLLLNFNYISDIDFGDLEAHSLTELQRLEISDNLLNNFNIPAPLPSLKYLILNNNKTMETLIVSCQKALIDLQANCCSINNFWIEGEFVSLRKLSLKANNLSQVAVQEAAFPVLEQLYLCYNRIDSFNMCAPCPLLLTLDMSFNNLNCISFADIPKQQEPRHLQNLSIYTTEESLEIILGEISFTESPNIQLHFECNCILLFTSEEQRKKVQIYLRDLSNDQIGRLWLMSYNTDAHTELKHKLAQTNFKEESIQSVMLEDAFHSYVRVGSDGLEALATFPNFDLVSQAVELHQKIRDRNTRLSLIGVYHRQDTSEEVRENLLSEEEATCNTHIFRCRADHELVLVQNFSRKSRCGGCKALLQSAMLRECLACDFRACIACPK